MANNSKVEEIQLSVSPDNIEQIKVDILELRKAEKLATDPTRTLERIENIYKSVDTINEDITKLNEYELVTANNVNDVTKLLNKIETSIDNMDDVYVKNNQNLEVVKSQVKAQKESIKEISVESEEITNIIRRLRNGQ